jgi:hypothetical protein
MLLLTTTTTPDTVTDLAGPLAYWGPASRQHTARTAHPRRVASGRTPLQVAAEACRGTSPRRAASLPSRRAA